MIALLTAGIGTYPGGSQSAVYNLHLVTDNVPDYTDMESFVRSCTDAWNTPQEKCIAIWRWGRRSRRQTSCAGELGRTIWDPILHYNSYGAMNCGIISSLNLSCWLQLGYQARYIQLGDHTVSEVSWDDGESWHLFDSSMSIFCYDHAGQVASCRQIMDSGACELSGGRSEPGHLYYYHYAPQCGSHAGPTGWRCAADQPVGYGRTLAAGASSYTDGFSADKYTQHARFGHRYVLNLRPHESYTRYWEPLDDAPGGGTDTDDPRYFRPMADGSDPDDQHGLNNIRGNGRWVFQPDLGEPGCLALLYDRSGVVLNSNREGKTGARLHPDVLGRAASAVFKISAANVITAMQIEAGALRTTEADSLRLFVSRDAGINWQPVWESRKTGLQPIHVELQEEIAGVTQCLLKFEITAAREKTQAGLNSLKVTTITQLNRRALPSLTLGSNRVALFADRQTDTTVLWPALHAGRYRETAAGEEDVHSADQPDGMYKATLGAGAKDKPCSVTWRIDVPSDVKGVTYGVISTNRSSRSYVLLQSSWDGRRFSEFHRNADGDFPFDEQVIHTIGGDQVVPGTRQAWFRGEFFCTSGEATYNMPGIQDLLVQVEHQARDAAFKPIEVTYNWTEHRQSEDVTRQHTELVGNLPSQHVINTAGERDPTMNWVRINLKGFGPDGDDARYGYSDGIDVGAAFERLKLVHTWGKQLAADKPYTASRRSTTSLGNPDSDGSELTNGMIIAPTAATANQHVQPATAFWSAGEPVSFVVDLGKHGTVAAVRVSTHQPNAEFCHPKTIEVAVSTDGRTWRQSGIIRHDDLWQPPGDYEPWEHDDDPDYAGFPAGGRLAYSYPLVFDKPAKARYVRLVCAPLDGRGMGLSEFQVFDRADVTPWPEEIKIPIR